MIFPSGALAEGGVVSRSVKHSVMYHASCINYLGDTHGAGEGAEEAAIQFNSGIYQCRLHAWPAAAPYNKFKIKINFNFG